MNETNLTYCVIDDVTYFLPEDRSEVEQVLAEQCRESAKVYVAPYKTPEEADANGWADAVETGRKVYAAAPEGGTK